MFGECRWQIFRCEMSGELEGNFLGEGEFFTGKCSGECLGEFSRVSVGIVMQDYKSLHVAVTI